MKYKVSDVKRILNLSKDTLRYFDNKRLISSARDKNNYRYFKSQDINKIFAYKMYRSLLFNMKDAENLVSGHSVENQQRMLENQLQFIQSEQEYLNRAKRHLEMLSEKLQRWEVLKEAYEIVTSHECYYHCNQTGDQFIESEEVLRNTHAFLNQMPDLWPAFSYQVDCGKRTADAGAGSDAGVSFGYAVYTDESHLVENLTHLPSVPCVHTFLTVRDDFEAKLQEILEEAERFCSAKGYQMTGGVYGNMLHEIIENREASQLFDVYLPIKKK